MTVNSGWGYFLLILTGYVIGSIPFAVLIGKLKNVDVREKGSRNPGAANVSHTLGFKFGIVVGVLDALKSAVPVFLINRFMNLPPWVFIIFSVSFILGHNYSIFLKFKGGKGISTAMGVVVAVTPVSYLVGMIVLIIFTIKKQIAPGMLVLFSLIPLLNLLFYHNVVYFILGLVIWFILVFRRITCTSNYSKEAVSNKFIYDNEEKTVAKIVSLKG
ncbi:MAG: hypothetical protein GWP03_00150 [Proteobacteria bacterium]|nr:hypothetical protein [Pseudomonadota bacterium]